MRYKQITAAIMIICVMAALLAPSPARAMIKTGQCGDHLTYELDTARQTLTISGTGDMWDNERNSFGFGTPNDIITTLILKDGITSIADHAFSGLHISSAVIPEGVTKIGSSAFLNCSQLKNVRLPSTVQRIGDEAFRLCESLKSIVLPDSVISVGTETFAQTALTEATLSKSLSRISAGMFRETWLESIVIPEGVTSIGGSAFAYSTLSGVTLPHTLTRIEEKAFYGTHLKQLSLPASLTELGEQAFSSCGWLTSVEMPDGITVLPERLFEGCSSLKGIRIPARVVSIDDYAFAGCGSMSAIEFSQGLQRIGEGALFECKSLPAVLTLPGGLRYLGGIAFYSCSQLEQVILPSGLTEIGDAAFTGCYGLKRMTIPEGVKRLGPHTFKDATALERLDLPDSMESIDDTALEGVDTVIRCSADSYAERWAKEHGFLLVHREGPLETPAVTEPSVTETPAPALAQVDILGNGAALFPGESTQLTAEVKPDQYTVTWSSSDDTIATVSSEGMVMALRPGRVMITASAGGDTAQTEVLVKAHVKDFKVDAQDAYIVVGTTRQMKVGVLPEDAVYQLAFSSDNPSILTVNPIGVCTAQSLGIAKLTIQDVLGGFSLDITVHVCPPVTEVRILSFENYLHTGDTKGLNVNVFMGKGNACVNQLVSYSVSDPKVLAVDEYGWITALAPGSAVITATAESGVSCQSDPVYVYGVPGDVTCDGKADIMDVIRLLKYVSGWSVEILQVNADVTGDGGIDIMDVIRLLKHVSGWSVPLG